MTVAVLERAPAHGDVEALRDASWFTSLYERTFDNAFRMAMSLTHDRFTAEDVVAEAFARIWHRRESFSGGSELHWVLSVIRNRAVDVIRTRRPVVDLDAIGDIEDPEEPVDEGPPVALALLKTCLTSLTAEQQEVIFLRFYQGLSHEQVARRMGKNANAVRAIQFRALARLKSLLEDSLVSR